MSAKIVSYGFPLTTDDLLTISTTRVYPKHKDYKSSGY